MSSPNPNALTYNGWVTAIATLAVYNTTVSGGGVVTPVDTAFANLIPSMLNYAELRIQKDLDLLPSQIASASYTMTAGSNTLQVSANDFVTIQTINYTSGTTNLPILPASKEFIQNVWNDSGVSFQGPPQYYCMHGGDVATGGNTSNIIVFGPFPDQNYPLLITGTQWLPSLYATAGTNGLGTTYISTNYPDLLIMASMIVISQYQRQFGPTMNDPTMPSSYEYQYGVLLKGALELENRKKFRDAAWSSQSQSPVATPSR